MPQEHPPVSRVRIARRASAPVLGAQDNDELSTVMPRRNTIHGTAQPAERLPADIMEPLIKVTEALRRFNETQQELRDLLERIQRGEYPPDEEEVVPVAYQAPTVEDVEDTEEESEWVEPFRRRHQG
ncbi:hypothetical protein LTR66_000631 [Elasticomyces elasticus]|nr:hypothetical protein LTR66_000631 [Elasticomyces elasticus]